jgi:nucleoside-diphosphate-sugar epimerase
MADLERPTIAVLGAAGFLGAELMRQLEQAGIRAAALVRGPAELAVEGDFHLAISSDGGEEIPRFETVVNLAYPTSGLPFTWPFRDAEIAATVERLVEPGGRLIHASSLAVFGYALDRAPRPAAVVPVRDLPYVESKISAEVYCGELRRRASLSLDVVRLGNIWGPGSGAWTVSVVQRLLTGRPVAVSGAPGFSNVTDVANAASYFVHLLRSEATPAGTRYHHLAELADVTWPQWAGVLADVLGVEPVLAPAGSSERPDAPKAELRQALAPFGARKLYRGLADQRVLGSYVRGIIRKLPPGVRAKLRPDLVFAAPSQLRVDEVEFLTIVAGTRKFQSVLDPAWRPPLGAEDSKDRAARWLEGTWTL